MNLTDFCFRRHSNNRQFVFPVQHPDLYELTSWQQYISVDLGMTPLSLQKMNSRFNMVKIKENHLEWTRSLCEFLRHLLSVQVETLPYHREILRWDSLSLRSTAAKEWILGICSSSLLIFAEPSATGKMNSPFFWDIRTSFVFSRLGYISDASNFSNSSSISPAIKA